MSCTKNNKRFLWIKYLGSHNWRITEIRKFMNTSEKFIVTSECVSCGCKETEHFVTHEELLLRGITNEQIKSASNTNGIYLTETNTP